MVEDNTPLLYGVGAVQRLRRRKRVQRFVDEMLNEATMSAHQMVFPEKEGWPTDTGVFYYPGIDQGIVVYGPISVKDMCLHFFKETLPNIIEGADQFASLPIASTVKSAMERGMFAFFGTDGTLNQVMSASPKVTMPDGGEVVADTFDNASSSVAYKPSLNATAPGLIPFVKFAPSLKWMVEE